MKGSRGKIGRGRAWNEMIKKEREEREKKEEKKEGYDQGYAIPPGTDTISC